MEADVVAAVLVGLDDSRERLRIAIGHGGHRHHLSLHGLNGLVVAHPGRDDLVATEEAVVVHVEGQTVEARLLQVYGRCNHPVVGRSLAVFVASVVEVGILRSVPIAVLPRVAVLVGIDDGVEFRTDLRVFEVVEVRRLDGFAELHAVRLCRLTFDVAVVSGDHIIIISQGSGGDGLHKHALCLMLAHRYLVGITHDGVVQVVLVHIALVHTRRRGGPCELDFVLVAGLGHSNVCGSNRGILADELIKMDARTLAGSILRAHLKAIHRTLCNGHLGLHQRVGLALSFGNEFTVDVDAVAQRLTAEALAGIGLAGQAEVHSTREGVAGKGGAQRSTGCGGVFLGCRSRDIEAHELLAVGKLANERGFTRLQVNFVEAHGVLGRAGSPKHAIGARVDGSTLHVHRLHAGIADDGHLAACLVDLHKHSVGTNAIDDARLADGHCENVLTLVELFDNLTGVLRVVEGSKHLSLHVVGVHDGEILPCGLVVTTAGRHQPGHSIVAVAVTVLQQIPVLDAVFIPVVVEDYHSPEVAIVQHVQAAIGIEGATVGLHVVALDDTFHRAGIVGSESVDTEVARAAAVCPLVAIDEQTIDLRWHRVVGSYHRDGGRLALLRLERLWHVKPGRLCDRR